MRTVTDSGLELIKHHEGLRLKSYQDVVGVWTIGYGHTKTARPRMSITEGGADELLRNDLTSSERGVVRLTKVPLSDGQFDALVSFVFNLGAGAYQRSTLRMKLNRGEYLQAAKEFDRWVYAGGRKWRGLINRRADEKRLFLCG